MQNLLRSVSAVLLCAVILLYAGCENPEPAEPVTDIQIEKLNGSWKATEVVAGGLPQDEYKNFVITLSGVAGRTDLDYVIEGRPFVSPWLQKGALSFNENDPEHTLLRDDAVSIGYDVTGVSLTFSFAFSGEGYVNGRTSSLKGEWQFRFVRQ